MSPCHRVRGENCTHAKSSSFFTSLARNFKHVACALIKALTAPRSSGAWDEGPAVDDSVPPEFCKLSSFQAGPSSPSPAKRVSPSDDGGIGPVSLSVSLGTRVRSRLRDGRVWSHCWCLDVRGFHLDVQ